MSAERNFATPTCAYEDVDTAQEHLHGEVKRAAAYNDLFIAPQCYAGSLKPEARIGGDFEYLMWQRQHMDEALGADWYHDPIKLALGV